LISFQDVLEITLYADISENISGFLFGAKLPAANSQSESQMLSFVGHQQQGLYFDMAMLV
jgi:hypothetical protein